MRILSIYFSLNLPDIFTFLSAYNNLFFVAVNVDHGIGARGFPSSARRESGCPPSSTKASSHDLGKHLVRTKELFQLSKTLYMLFHEKQLHFNYFYVFFWPS